MMVEFFWNYFFSIGDWIGMKNFPTEYPTVIMWLQAFYDICNIDSLLWTDKNTAVSLKAGLVLRNGNMEIVSKYFALYFFFLFLLPIFGWAEVWKLHFNYITFSAVKFVTMVTHSNWRMQLICLILYWQRKEILGPKMNKVKVKDRVSLRKVIV